MGKNIMYRMKNIVIHDIKIDLPKCMYSIKKRDFSEDETDINISDQVIKFLKKSNKMMELEQRQDQLLQKLDTLYERIKSISTLSEIQEKHLVNLKTQLPIPDEVVLIVSPDSLPWYINIILKQLSLPVNIISHIHSSVSKEKVPKINNFVKSISNYYSKDSKVNIRVIFKSVSADTELKLTSLAVPIIGNVNILRYLSYIYPNIVRYDANDHWVDHLLDLVHILERSSEKNKEALVNKLFAQCKDWIYGNEFSIVDIAAYNVLKQWKNIPKYVHKAWFDKCEKLLS